MVFIVKTWSRTLESCQLTSSLFTFPIARLTVQFPERPEVQLYTAASLEKLTFAFEDW